MLPRPASLIGDDPDALPGGTVARELPSDLALEERRLAERRLRFFVGLAWLFVPAFALPFAFSPATRLRAGIVVGWGLAVLLTPVLLGAWPSRGGEGPSAPSPGRLKLAAHWFIACCWASLAAETFLLGGLGAHSNLYLPLLPCLAILLAGTGAALPWAAVCAATTLLAAALDLAGLLPPQELGPSARVLHAGGTMLFGIGLSAGLGLLFARQKDVVLARIARERAELAWKALHDALTGLPNRMLLADRLETALARARRAGRRVALVYLDLDGFKAVNDSRGHAAGDDVLRDVARRVGAAVRSADTLARVGGDEFVVVAEGIVRRDDAAALLRNVEQALAGSGRGGRRPIPVSLGLALYPDDGETPEALLAAADAAMYHAKRGGSAPTDGEPGPPAAASREPEPAR